MVYGLVVRSTFGMRKTMFKRIIFLVLGMIISDMHAMECGPKSPRKQYSDIPESKSPKKQYLDIPESEKPFKKRYLNISNRSRSVSLNEAPHSSFRESEGSPKKSKKDLKLIRERSESPNNRQDPIEQRLLKAVTEDDTFDVQYILHPDVNIVDSYGRTLLILTIQKDNDILVKEFLAHRSIDVNKSDTWGNTPLHHVALRGNETIANLLLRDHRVNSFIKNNAKILAHHLIDDKSYPKNIPLKLWLFARTSLDIIVAQEAYTLGVNNEGNNEEAMKQTIETIRKRFASDHEHQQDYQALPDATKFPHYATDEFLKKMILYRIKCDDLQNNLNY